MGFSLGDFNVLKELQNKFKNEEKSNPQGTLVAKETPPLNKLREKHGDKVDLLSPVANKLLAYLFENNPERVEQYAKEKSGEYFVRDMRNAFSNPESSLPSQHILKMDEIFPYLLKKVPVTEEYKRVYGDLAREAGCSDEELEEAISILSRYSEKAIDMTFKNVRKAM